MTQERKGREGNRWYNERPSGEDVAKWFKDEVPMHEEGLDAKDYVGGVVMIQQTEKTKEVVEFRDGRPVFDDRENLVYTPYVKVETRVAYFWKWVGLHENWLGVIEPAEIPPFAGEQMLHMPPGCFLMDVYRGQELTRFVGCSMRVTIYDRETVEYRDGKVISGKPIAVYPPGTRIVSVLDRYGADVNSVMKAETGAVGRALGMAGVLVVPGSGIASGEDMLDGQAGHSASTIPEGQQAPGVALPTVAEAQGSVAAPIAEEAPTMGEQVLALWETLKALNVPEGKKEFETWAKAQGVANVGALTQNAELAKLAVKKLEAILDRLESQATGEGGADDGDAFGA